MNFSLSHYSATGSRRTNEDAASVLENGSSVLGMVADGLGGHADGDKAACLAVSTLNSTLWHAPLSEMGLRSAIEDANRAVWDADAAHRMRTTLAVFWQEGPWALVAHVGDTRIYQFRDGRIAYQSRDHSLCQLEVQIGMLSPSEIRGNKDRNILIRALGAEDGVNADIRTLSICPGDAFLLCSDGFWDHIWENEMLQDLRGAQTAALWLDRMRGRVEKRSGSGCDNHTAVALMIQ